MNPAHLHLLLNHVPVLGTIFGLLLVIAALARRNHTMLRAAYVAFIVSAVAAIPVYLTGGGAEDQVEGARGGNERFIDEHEDAATIALVGVGVLGVLSIAAAIISARRGRTAPALGVAILVTALGVSGLMAWTANLGGAISHSEIRSSSSAPGAGSGERNGNDVEQKHDDD
jgi:hypothetical protein